jgi:hypothetical protein
MKAKYGIIDEDT